MKKEFITWDRLCVDGKYNADPTYGVTEGKWNIDFKETGYGNTDTDARFLGTIEYDDTVVSEEVVTKFINKFSYHSFTRVTDEKVSELLLEWYGSEVILDSNRIIQDNRPNLEM